MKWLLLIPSLAFGQVGRAPFYVAPIVAAGGSPSFTVDQNPGIGYVDNTATAISISFASLPTAGRTVIVTGSAYDFDADFTIGVADNQGNTYTVRQASNTDYSAWGRSITWVAYCASIGSPSGTFTVTATMVSPTSSNYLTMGIIECHGLAASPEDAAANATVNDYSITTNDIAATTGTLAQANEVIIGSAALGAHAASDFAFARPSGWTEIVTEPSNAAHQTHSSAYKVVTATTAVTGQWSHNNESGSEACAVLVCFKLQ